MKRIFIGAAFITLTCFKINASVIEYNGYSRDNSGVCEINKPDCDYNIVKGKGVEWLKWSVTSGNTIDQALFKFEKNGWRLASKNQMASLFNSFGLELLITPPNSPNIIRSYASTNNGDEHLFANFSSLFDRAFEKPSPISSYLNYSEQYKFYDFRGANFGEEINSVIYPRHASIVVSIKPDLQKKLWEYQVSGASWHSYWESSGPFGVALVRAAQSDAQSVSSPYTSSLIFFGLVFLILRRYKWDITLYTSFYIQNRRHLNGFVLNP